ncbi:MAG: hypothetical protein IKM24_05100 [Clostridia bacterium]|nr:hypothetical protein [Clostridia bacterium]
MKIEEIDRNFTVSTNIDRPDMVFFDCRQTPFSVHGVFYENGRFRRMPEATARTVSEGVFGLHANTAGGRVRFVTDSPYIAIHAKMDNIGKMPHFPLTGSAGFDLYTGRRYLHTFVPPYAITDGYEAVAICTKTCVTENHMNSPCTCRCIRMCANCTSASKRGARFCLRNPMICRIRWCITARPSPRAAVLPVPAMPMKTLFLPYCILTM